jgi:hypothetical protein
LSTPVKISRWQVYGRAIAAVIVAGATVLASALTDGHVDRAEEIQIAIQVTTAAGVWLVPNLPRSTGIKTGLAAILAVLNLAATLITGGLTGAELVNLVIAGLGVLAVGQAPSLSKSQVALPPASP